MADSAIRARCIREAASSSGDNGMTRSRPPFGVSRCALKSHDPLDLYLFSTSISPPSDPLAFLQHDFHEPGRYYL